MASVQKDRLLLERLVEWIVRSCQRKERVCMICQDPAASLCPTVAPFLPAAQTLKHETFAASSGEPDR